MIEHCLILWMVRCIPMYTRTPVRIHRNRIDNRAPRISGIYIEYSWYNTSVRIRSYWVYWSLCSGGWCAVSPCTPGPPSGSTGTGSTTEHLGSLEDIEYDGGIDAEVLVYNALYSHVHQDPGKDPQEQDRQQGTEDLWKIENMIQHYC